MSWQSTPASRRLVLTSMFCLVSTQQAHAAQEQLGRHSSDHAARAQNQLAAEARREAMEQAREALHGAREAMNNARRSQIELRTPGFNAVENNRDARIELREDYRQTRRELRLEHTLLHNASRDAGNKTLASSPSLNSQSKETAGSRHLNKSAARTSTRETRPPSAVSTISDTGALDRVIDLDLTSADSNIVLGRKMFRGEDSVTIRVGTEDKTFSAGSQVTAAEYVAIRQKLDGGSQLLELNAQGSAIGGSFELDTVVSRQVDDLVIPANVSGIEYFTRNNSTIRVGGDLTNYGSLIAASAKKNVDSGTIAGNNIFNMENGIIATGFPEQMDVTIISGGGGSIDIGGGSPQPEQPEPQFRNSLNLNLTLKADDDIVNLGKIASNRAINIEAGGSIVNGVAGQVSYEPVVEPPTGPSDNGSIVASGSITLIGSSGGGINLPGGKIYYLKDDPVYRQRDLLNGSITARGDINLSSGNGSLTNYGNITAGSNHEYPRDINITTPGKTTDVNIEATGGVFRTDFGNINVRDASYKGASNINMVGGDYLSKQLNLFSGSGTIEGNVGKVTGTLNTVAGIEHFYAATEMLTIGNNCITGDPTFANTTGDIQIVGLNTFGEAVAFLANGNITADSSAQIVANGFNVYMIAGAAITVSAGPETNSVPGTAIGAGTTATVDFSNGNGGSINLSTSNAGTIIDTSSSTGNGGDIVLAARSNGTVGGYVVLDVGTTIDSSSTFADANGGSITVLAGANPVTAAPSIQGGNFLSSALSGTGTAGSITLVTAQPTATSGTSITFDSFGQVIAGGPVVAQALAPNAQINIGTVTAQSFSSANTVNISAGDSVITGAITAANDVTISSGVSIDASSIVSGGNVFLTTPVLINDGTITSSKTGGLITVQNAAGLSLGGTGSISLTGGGAGAILLDAGANNALAFTTSHTLNPGASGSLTWLSEDEGGSITIAPAITLTVNDGGTLNIGTPKLRFLGNGSLIDAAMASAININSGGGPNSLTIELPDNGTATIVTTGGTISIEPTDGMDLSFTNPGGTGLAELNLNGGPVFTETSAASTFVNEGVALRSNNALTMDAGSGGGISGYGFQPYVGDYFNGNMLPQFNAYDLATVKALLQQLKDDGITNVSTYGQGSFTFAGQFYGPDTSSAGSNKYIIQAAYELGMTVSAGAFQQDLVGDNFDINKTKVEIQYILDQAQKYPGTVKEIIVCNESIMGLNSTNQLIQLISDAKVMRDNTPVSAGSDTKFNASTLPITTRQQWGALAGVDSLPNGDPLKPVMKTLVNTVEGHIYGNMYAYFDGALPQSYNTAPDGQTAFVTAVTNSMTGTLNAFRTAFSNQGVTTEIRIGETGWPSLGLRLGPLPPAPALGDLTLAKWYYQAMREWAATANVTTTYFQSYDQPWQTVPLANVPTSVGSSEGYFGLYRAIGNNTTTQFTLTSIESKFGPGAVNSLGSNTRMLSNDGIIAANNVSIATQRLDNDGTISALSSTGGVAVSSVTDLAVVGSGTVNRTGGGTGGISFTSAGANDIVVEGNHTFDAGAGNPVAFNAIADGASFTLAQGASINLPTNNTAFSINAEHIIYNGTINDNSIVNPGTTVTFNSADSSTISNSVGDLDLKGVTVNVATGHLAILAKGSIINTGETANINVSSNVGAGGNVLMIAGHSFQTIDLDGEDAVYALDDVSTSSGNVVLPAAGHEININTSGATDAGNIEIYANGSISLNNITATGGTGSGGNLTIRGSGITVQGAIDTAGATGSGSGSVDLQSGVVVHSGVDVHGGRTESGTFSLASFSGDITVGDIATSEGSVRLQTDGTGTIRLTGAMPVAHDISLLAGTGTLDLPTNTITAVEDTAGNGGEVRVSASAFTNPATIILNAIGTTTGGAAHYTNTSTTAQQLDSTKVQIHARGANGGSAEISTGGDLTIVPDGIFDVQPTGANGNGAAISITAGALAPGNLLVSGSLNAGAMGTGIGGTIELNSNSSADFEIGNFRSSNGITGSIVTQGSGTSTPASLSITNRGGGIYIKDILPVTNNLTLSTTGATAGDITLKKEVNANGLLTISLGGTGRLQSKLLSADTIQLQSDSSNISATLRTDSLSVASGGSVTLKVIVGLNGPPPGSPFSITAATIAGDFKISVVDDIHVDGDIEAANVSLTANNHFIYANANIMANDTNGVASLYATGAIDGPATSAVIQASKVELIAGGIGVGNSVRVNTSELIAESDDVVNINSVGSAILNLTKASANSQFNLTASGAVAIATNIKSATNILVDTTGGAGDILLTKRLGGSNLQQLDLRSGSGDITGGTATALNAFISTTAGDVGTAGSPLDLEVRYLTVNSGGSAHISNASKNSQLGISSSSGDFVYENKGSVVLDDVSTTDGAIQITAKGQLDVLGDLLASSNGAAGTATITLQSIPNKQRGIRIDDGSMVETSGVGGGDVKIFVGKKEPAWTTSLPDGANGNLVVTTSGGGQVFVNEDTVEAAGTAFLNAIGKNVYISGASARNKVTLGVGAVITADPPVTETTSPNLFMSSNPAQVSSKSASLGNEPRYTASTTLPLEAATSQLLDVGLSPNYLNTSFLNQSTNGSVSIVSNADGMELANSNSHGADSSVLTTDSLRNSVLGNPSVSAAPEETQFLGSTSDRYKNVDAVLHYDATTKHVMVENSNKLFAPSVDTTVSTPNGTVSIAKNSLVLVMVQPNSVSVFDLHDEHKGAVRISEGTHSFTLHPGQQATVTKSSATEFHAINPSEHFGYRHMSRRPFGHTSFMFSSDVSIPSIISATKPLKSLLKSSHNVERRIANQMVKTAAVLTAIDKSTTPYDTMPHPRLMVCNK
ncbi:hypothetical protein KF728_14280 [Candidatus Obscuribacterales bacterium]|nr:hypothetical protein [Candidatus Obscuribacterales bacterium]